MDSYKEGSHFPLKNFIRHDEFISLLSQNNCVLKFEYSTKVNKKFYEGLDSNLSNVTVIETYPSQKEQATMDMEILDLLFKNGYTSFPKQKIFEVYDKNQETSAVFQTNNNYQQQSANFIQVEARTSQNESTYANEEYENNYYQKLERERQKQEDFSEYLRKCKGHFRVRKNENSTNDTIEGALQVQNTILIEELEELLLIILKQVYSLIPKFSKTQQYKSVLKHDLKSNFEKLEMKANSLPNSSEKEKIIKNNILQRRDMYRDCEFILSMKEGKLNKKNGTNIGFSFMDHQSINTF